jgi:hypothetical protein
LPASITWPRYLLALAGIGLAVRRRRPRQLLLLLFVATFLATISLSSLHWQRWIIQVLPVLALFTAAALYGLTLRASRVLGLQAQARNALDDYRREGFDYLVVSDDLYGRYFSEAEKYPHEVAFYSSLFEQGKLVQQFEPSAERGGPVIRIYQISGALVAPDTPTASAQCFSCRDR